MTAIDPEFPSPPRRAANLESQKAIAILDAALDAFSQRGFDGTPVPVVADLAGVAAGPIYRYFPGKRGLVNALYQRWKSRLAAAVIEEIPADQDARIAFRGIWRRLVGFAVEFPRAFLFLETHHHSAYLDQESQQIGEELDLAIGEWVRQWQSAGEVRSGDADILVAQVYGGFVGVVRQRNQRAQALTDQLFDDTVDAAWALLAAPRQELEPKQGEV